MAADCIDSGRMKSKKLRACGLSFTWTQTADSLMCHSRREPGVSLSEVWISPAYLLASEPSGGSVLAVRSGINDVDNGSRRERHGRLSYSFSEYTNNELPAVTEINCRPLTA